ncbi:methyltransferase domain-containing protein [Nostoc sp. FACHB-152]|uniref:class I SAM-dependent methyltransferase n=1 Tax=unclassified Nostoc TaxID=2593658 RepID=UPI00168733DB|nr:MULTISPECIES: methyltransferase domain-containing protein [unclassified Nostoc]MBD2451659.1 methyltransferase domain-containing protein [Nostoc sp. FACHB-152]MBD2469720.1 methyltransferase domain-containing protein [Nostoc sp. FACHB-145]
MTSDPTIAYSAFQQFERARFSQIAQEYDQTIAAITSGVNNAILDAVGAKCGIQLLDVACGTGWLSAAAVERQAIVTGLDLAENMVAIARVRCPQAQFYTGDALDLPFDSNQFEAVVCNLGILHFPEPEKAIAESFRVLKSGGRYAFTCWTPPQYNPFMALILGSVQTYGNMDVNLPPGPPLFRFGDPTECTHVLSATGFTQVSVNELPIKWTFSKPEDVMPTVVISTARLGPMLAMQTSEQRHHIENAIIEGASKYATDNGVEIPASVVLAVASKP